MSSGRWPLEQWPQWRIQGSGTWPFHLHDLIRSAIRNADDANDDRWLDEDWRRAAERAFRALEAQWRQDPRYDRTVLVGCLQQGLALAQDFDLDLDWLADAAFQRWAPHSVRSVAAWK
ncbi:hypothetical protein ACFW9V_02595 [Streptomyces hygroscopicus]|uniref:hypothetical protein n=1 Tax=Streptomyces hygroscopicus TaxID=1912 RepID=UPI0033CE64AC